MAEDSIFKRIQEWVIRPGATKLLLLWSFAEAIGWFILPDYLLFLYALLAPARWKEWYFKAWIASTVGSIGMYTLCRWQPAGIASWLFHLPFTHPQMLGHIAQRYAEIGLPAILLQPISGIPAKVWIYGATNQFHWPPLVFLTLLATGRVCRMALVSWLGNFIGKISTPFLQRHWPILWVAYTILFFYGLLKTSQ